MKAIDFQVKRDLLSFLNTNWTIQSKWILYTFLSDETEEISGEKF